MRSAKNLDLVEKLTQFHSVEFVLAFNLTQLNVNSSEMSQKPILADE